MSILRKWYISINYQNKFHSPPVFDSQWTSGWQFHQLWSPSLLNWKLSVPVNEKQKHIIVMHTWRSAVKFIVKALKCNSATKCIVKINTWILNEKVLIRYIYVLFNQRYCQDTDKQIFNTRYYKHAFPK